MNTEELPISPTIHTVARRLGLDPAKVDINDVCGHIDTPKLCLRDASERLNELLIQMPRDPQKKVTRPLESRRNSHLEAIKHYNQYGSR